MKYSLALVVMSPMLFGDALAAQPSIELKVGFDNVCKIGHWTPVQVRIQAGDSDVRGRLELSTVDGDGVDCVYSQQQTQDVVVPAGEGRQFLQYVRMGRTRGQLQARVVHNQTEVASGQIRIGTEVRSLFSTQRWILVIGGPLDLQPIFDRNRLQAQHAFHVTQINDAEELPDAWFGFEGVDAIVLTTGQLENIEQLSRSKVEAIERWTRMGGTLLISMGTNGPKLAGEGGLLRRFAPSSIVAAVRVQEAPGIESFARADQRLPEFTLSVLNEPDGDVVAFVESKGQGERSAIVRSSFSFGKIIFLAFDLDTEPWRSWAGKDVVLGNLLFDKTSGEEQSAMADKEQLDVSNIGYKEMSGQMRMALDHFPGTGKRSGVTVVTFWTVFPLFLAYIALLGPGDFFLLRRFIRRMEWTWVTFPLLIVLTSAAIYVLGIYWRGGNQLRLNQIDVVDVDPVHGVLRGTTFAQLYSPTSAMYQLNAQPTPALARGVDESDEGTLLTWQGMPGEGLGGFDKEKTEILRAAPYRLVSDDKATSTRLDQLLLPTAAGKTFLGRWWRDEQLAAPSAIRLDHNDVLHGVIENPLSVALTDAMIVHDQWVYRLERTLEPGDSVNLDDLTRRDLEWRLTRRHVLQESTSYASTPWDPQSQEVTRIMELMMFHDAAGGQDYTGLTQRYQGFVDLTEQLRLGKAILVGRSAQPALQLRSNDTSLTDAAEQKWTWYRIMLPVQREAGGVRLDKDELTRGL